MLPYSKFLNLLYPHFSVRAGSWAMLQTEVNKLFTFTIERCTYTTRSWYPFYIPTSIIIIINKFISSSLPVSQIFKLKIWNILKYLYGIFIPWTFKIHEDTSTGNNIFKAKLRISIINVKSNVILTKYAAFKINSLLVVSGQTSQ